MKRILALILCFAMLASLTACGCKHQWIEATCLEAKTCSECGEVEGEALGHSWVEAACETPKTCSVCAVTEGEALGHDWQDATTEAPKTCANCAATEGERIITDARFETASCSFAFGAWAGQSAMSAAEVLGIESEEEVVFNLSFTFNNDGSMVQQMSFDDWESAKGLFLDAIVEVLYAQYEMMGLDRKTAQQAVKSELGMTIEELAQYSLDSIDPAMYEEPMDGVYYVIEDTMYMSASWGDMMEKYTVTVDGDTMTLTDESGETVVLTRVAE